MKIRTGFVSNSSSSSFIVNKTNLSHKQITFIHDHTHIGRRFFMNNTDDDDKWDVKETDECIYLSTFMDNFDMNAFLTFIGVPDSDISEG